jgi:quercetin dioxygenase-like cupin family protein
MQLRLSGRQQPLVVAILKRINIACPKQETVVFFSPNSTVTTTHRDPFDNHLLVLSGQKRFYVSHSDRGRQSSYIKNFTPKTHPGEFQCHTLGAGDVLTVPSQVLHYVESDAGTVAMSFCGKYGYGIHRHITPPERPCSRNFSKPESAIVLFSIPTCYRIRE